MVETGQTVFVKGTGRWYHGSSYSATVVDVREEDDTIKVNFIKGDAFDLFRTIFMLQSHKTIKFFDLRGNQRTLNLT